MDKYNKSMAKCMAEEKIYSECLEQFISELWQESRKYISHTSSDMETIVAQFYGAKVSSLDRMKDPRYCREEGNFDGKAKFWHFIYKYFENKFSMPVEECEIVFSERGGLRKKLMKKSLSGKN
jgi:hypothetical protein